jgi:hypothetical protein
MCQYSPGRSVVECDECLRGSPLVETVLLDTAVAALVALESVSPSVRLDVVGNPEAASSDVARRSSVSRELDRDGRIGLSTPACSSAAKSIGGSPQAARRSSEILMLSYVARGGRRALEAVTS